MTWKRPSDNPRKSHYGGRGFSRHWDLGCKIFYLGAAPFSVPDISIQPSIKPPQGNILKAVNNSPHPIRLTNLELSVSNQDIPINSLNFDDPLVNQLPWESLISAPITIAANQMVDVDISDDPIPSGYLYFIRYRTANPETGENMSETVISYNSEEESSGQKKETKRFSIGIGLKGGWSSWALDDFVLSKEYFENLSEIPDYSATTKDLNGSPFGGVDLILEYNLPNYHKLGLSVGFQYFPGGTFEQSWSYQDTTSTNTLDLSAYAIPVELFYKPRVARNLSLKIGGSATFYNAAIDYNSSFSISGQEYSHRGKLKDSNIGGHVSLGAEYSLTKNLSLSVDAGYSFAKLNNFTGTLVDRDGTSTEMLLTMARDEFGEILSIYPTAEPLPQNYRSAALDFSGLKFSIGLKYFCPKCCKKRDENEEEKCEEKDNKKKCKGGCGGPKKRIIFIGIKEEECDNNYLESIRKKVKIQVVLKATKECMIKGGVKCRCVGGKLVKIFCHAKPIIEKIEVWDEEKQVFVVKEVKKCIYRCAYWYKGGKCKIEK